MRARPDYDLKKLARKVWVHDLKGWAFPGPLPFHLMRAIYEGRLLVRVDPVEKYEYLYGVVFNPVTRKWEVWS